MKQARATAEEWATRVSEWKASGESAEQFAQSRGWNPRTLMWWSSARRRTAKTPKVEQTSPSVPRFVEVTTSSRRRFARIEIVLRGGRRVRIDGDVEPARLRAIVTALES